MKLVPVWLAALSLVLPARAGVTVVDGDATVLQAAIDAAADGDILLIQPGDASIPFPASPSDVDVQQPVVVAGRSLTLVADGGPYLLRSLVVRDLPPGGLVVVRGLSLGASPLQSLFPVEPALEVQDCPGSVWVDTCSLAPAQQQAGGGLAGPPQPGAPALRAVNSEAVVVSDSTFSGGRGAPESASCTIPGYAPSSVGGDGLRLEDARVALHGSVVVGGVGGGPGGAPCSQGSQSAGGHGAQLLGASFLHAAGSTLAGADKSSVSLSPGSGLVIDGSGASARLRGVSVSAGSGLPVMPAIQAPPSSVTLLPAAPRGLAITSPLRVGEAGVLEVDGVVGELVAVFESPAGGWLDLPGKQGVLLLGAPLLGPVLALPNPSGALSLGFSTPPLLPPGVDGVTVLLQLLVKDGPAVLVEDVASCTVLGAAIP